MDMEAVNVLKDAILPMITLRKHSQLALQNIMLQVKDVPSLSDEGRDPDAYPRIHTKPKRRGWHMPCKTIS